MVWDREDVCGRMDLCFAFSLCSTQQIVESCDTLRSSCTYLSIDSWIEAIMVGGREETKRMCKQKQK